MSELDFDARALLDLGRDRLGPDPETVARLRGRIETAVAVAGTATVVASIASKLGVTSVKLALIATVTAASTVTAVEVVRHVHRAKHAPVAAPIQSGSSGKHAAKPAEKSTDVPADMPADTAPIAPPSTPASAASAAANAPANPPIDDAIEIDPPHARPPVVAPVRPPKHATLARETELVDRATRALHAGDLASVQTIIQLYASETGGAGQLAEDIAAIEIEALCRANDPDAPSRLAAFDARWPTAGQRHRLTAACKGSP